MLSELPLFLFTLLGGLASGIYCFSVVFPKTREGNKQIFVAIVVLALLACGCIALLFHLGRPERMLLAFRNLSAGIAQEGWATIIFGIVVVIDLALCIAKKTVPFALRVIGLVLGVVLVAVMANAYYSITINAALHSIFTFSLFILTAAAMGISFLQAFGARAEEADKNQNLASLITLALATVAIFLECIPYGTAQLSVIPFALAGVIAAAATACTWLEPKKGISFAYAGFALIVIAAVISRYGFYLAI